ncbi:MAG: metalloregulator ArsR/SmtB family transcription factor [Deltaproteobacteria bacterium]|nr:metalloregulator ArsR/SmtB family transcription factor [Deltaproteobacteria bacterium]
MDRDEAEQDEVFKALSDPSRRRMLDALKANGSMNVNEMTELFEFSRFAVMKHLRVLEGANLVVSQKVGRERRLFLNAVPIQTIYDRWISRFSALWAQRLTTLKYRLEEGGESMSRGPTQVHVVYIKTTPEKLWNAMMDPDVTQKYFHNCRVESDMQPGSPIVYKMQTPDGPVDAVKGKVIEIEPQKRFVHTFIGAMHETGTEESRVEYTIEPLGEIVRLTVTHSEFDGESELYKSTLGGWPPLISALKTLLETGQPMPMPPM